MAVSEPVGDEGGKMNVFETVQIGDLTLSNRLLMAPVKTGFGGPDGTVSDQMLSYYRRRAEGGVGGIVVEPLYVDVTGKEHPRQLAIDTDGAVAGLRRLVAAIHEGGAKAIAHLNHAGRAANPKASGRVPEAPSVVTCAATGATPQVLATSRIQELVQAFAEAARRAREAGFDAVEIQCGLGYLVAQFLAPLTNQRTDEFGGSPARRERFARDVIGAVTANLAGAIPTIARLSASEQVKGGLELDDGILIARRVVEWGVAAIHVVTGSACDTPPWYYQHMCLPQGINEQLAARIKVDVPVPVIVAGRLGDPDRIQEVIGTGQADLVAVGRPLVADPDLPHKMRRGDSDQIVLCGSCLQGCLANVKAGKGIGCIVNPEVGHEGESVPPPTRARRIVVVGGGPAGLTATIVARRRGHQVTLLERGELGGQFSLASIAPGKAAMDRPLGSLLRLARRSGAEIETGVWATVERVASLEPDVVVLATGSNPAKISVPGLENALTGNDVLSRKSETGHSVLIVGGGMVGIEVAEFLAAMGRTVAVVELIGEIARDMEPLTRKLTLSRLQKLPVEISTDTVLERFHDGMATVRGPDGTRELGPFDSVVVAVGTEPNNELAEPLRAKGLEVHVVGDAGGQRQVMGAVGSAWQAACSI
jgi:2,4-dienoyl-CoA reductase-like NADH-dependent reductase (Old Yellow Enzyme family)/thioredoxin reductase